MINKIYIHAPVLLNLLNLLQKSNKMLGKPCILSLFHNMFNKFNNTWARLNPSVHKKLNKNGKKTYSAVPL